MPRGGVGSTSLSKGTSMQGTSRSPVTRTVLAVSLPAILIAGTLQLARGQKRQNSPSLGSVLLHAQGPSRAGRDSTAGEIKLTGPYTFKNLTVFLIHGSDTIRDLHLLSLAEALKERIIVIRETGNVNELTVEN